MIREFRKMVLPRAKPVENRSGVRNSKSKRSIPIDCKADGAFVPVVENNEESIVSRG